MQEYLEISVYVFVHAFFTHIGYPSRLFQLCSLCSTWIFDKTDNFFD